ncbi:DUF4148 domain-containing protein [Burkholderia sp. FERM BP-3421]|jgi:Domain of unknown function (DUF4148)|uniref:DUF4148 domain-containing protein n=1 Tax=Burkholderia sp. FERM BP-3421 TaxID=1494466 RepID=UPI0023603C5C|nr:DUF4148 domain-containing protein [Burkholderia sp. FERM BP-3421]WDD93636.1 DUF4148 domain-containing protein [Burkholderia sp. FERM BP-3421]
MNHSRLTLLLVLTCAAAPVLAQQSDMQPGKTRADVRAELIQAYRDGTIPTTDGDYPPSQTTIDINRARFAASNPVWAQQQQAQAQTSQQ